MLILIDSPVQAHEFRIGYLEIREGNAGEYRLSWRSPTAKTSATEFALKMHPACDLASKRDLAYDGWQVRDYVLDCRAASGAGWVSIEGLDRSPVDLLARLIAADGGERSIHLHGSQNQVDLAPPATVGTPLRGLLDVGAMHVFGGLDHLVYIVLLFMLLRHDLRQLVIGVTTFTIAHSVSLGLAATGVVHVPVRPVEAVIALTIIYFAASLSRGSQQPVSPLRWQLAILLCGLVHGLGFANSLADIGLSQGSLIWNLFTFNLGIEIAQLAVLALALLLTRLWRAIAPVSIRWMRDGIAVPAGAIGSFWYLQRVLG